MTRPAAFNKIWGYEALQITDENNEKTQEFMRTGWEGGSDKKAPSASVQNYHMQKTDQALQEIERQGYLSWRNDVPYVKGARVFFHGSTFHALKDNQDVEPQGSRDNGVWYLLPVQVYPARYDSVEGLGTAAKHNAEDFDAMGSAKAVQQVLDQMINSLGTAAKKNIDDFDLKGAAQTVQSNLEEFSQTLGSASKHAHEDYLDINNYLYTYCSGVTIYYTPRQTHVVSGTELIVNDSGFYYISGALRAWAHDGGGIGSNGTWGGILTVNGTGKGFQSGAMNALNDSNNRDATVPITGVQYLNKGDIIGVGFYCGGDGRQWDYAVTVATLFAKKVGK